MTWQDVIVALWFFVPAGVANMMPVFAAYTPGLRKWKTPLDMKRTYRGIRITGDNKTWRGLVVGTVAAIIILWLQQMVTLASPTLTTWTSMIGYQTLPIIIVGTLFGLGALLGDAVESFFKRQRRIPAGHSWFPFDQIDYIIGAALLTAPFVQLQIKHYALIIALWLVLHLAFSYVGYRLGLKPRPI